MIQPDDLIDISLSDDEERYKPLHSHVEHYNRRAAESAARLSESIPYLQANLEKRNSDEEEPFIAGFKHELDKYDFKQAEVDFEGNRYKREDEKDILGATEVAGDLVETISLRNHSLPNGESSGHATPHPKETNEHSDDYIEENTSISYETQTSVDFQENGKEQSVNHGFLDSEMETTQASIEEAQEEAYDYEKFRAEYDQQIEDAKYNNMTFNYTDNGEPEENAGDALKKIVEFDMPKNCTKEELTQFGVKALECLAFDYQNARNQSDVKRILARTWSVVRVWICIYVCIAVPCWCQKGWCCCCFRCGICFPEDRIFQAKHYYAHNAPGILVDQPRKKGEGNEPIKYKPTLFELDAYEKLESAIRNL